MFKSISAVNLPFAIFIAPFSTRIWMFLGLAVIMITSCKKEYTPTETSANVNYLVVEGVIDGSSDTTFINLSRTTNIGNALNAINELHATVKLEDDHNSIYTFTEKGLGIYYWPAFNFNSTQNSYKYRLRIKTATNREYLSDYVEVKRSPAIDSLSYKVGDNKVQIAVSTHDATNATRYYRWSYTETWQFNAAYESLFMSDGKKIIPRPASQQIYHCWSNNVGSILLSSTAKLSQDILVNEPITFIPSTSQKISIKYSILLKQYALTSDAFTYWQTVKKNTETLGGIFDAQPKEMVGNFQCLTAPGEPVIGYLSVGKVESKRIFIDKSALPVLWIPALPICDLYTVKLAMVNDYFLVAKPLYIPIAEAYDFNPLVFVGYASATPACGDCRLTDGGVTKKPLFWP